MLLASSRSWIILILVFLQKLHVNSARKPYALTLPVIKPQKLVKRVKRRCARKSMNANHTPIQNLIVETKERRCVTLNKKLNPNKLKSTGKDDLYFFELIVLRLFHRLRLGLVGDPVLQPLMRSF